MLVDEGISEEIWNNEKWDVKFSMRIDSRDIVVALTDIVRDLLNNNGNLYMFENELVGAKRLWIKIQNTKDIEVKILKKGLNRNQIPKWFGVFKTLWQGSRIVEDSIE